ncbi:MAG TPA: Grx4 family monothiol glutaredoxin [Candidatus Binatia bacterium]|jgi:monothiol glutaredoxin|nr:Grx4 family monothiol glutaredoxin [Candidatus Binatia bacterium]
MSADLVAMIKKEIDSNTICLFTKGTTDMPMCGFSARTIAIFKEIGKPFKTVDILPDPRIRQILSSVSSWPTIPQVFVGGKFIGGCDIVTEMHQKGELKPLVEQAFKTQPAPAR